MDVANPMQSVIPGAHGIVLAALSGTDAPLSGRRLAELAKPGFSQRRINEALRHLVDAGIVLRESRPPSDHYQLNHDHVAAEGIAALAHMWTALVGRIGAELTRWSVAAEAAWLLGPAARGEGAERSDLDILLVLPSSGIASSITEAWEHQTKTLIEKIKTWSGNRCNLVEMGAAELRAAVERDDRLIRDLREQGVVLTGHDPGDLLRKEFRQ
jgi:predicted nucleotidyltransferase